MLSKLALLAIITAILLPLTRAQQRGPTCRNLVIPVTIKGSNILMPDGGLSFLTRPNILGGLVQGLFSTLVPFAGTYSISARYCEPEVTNAKRRDTLQILVHPATYDKDYWSGGAAPGQGYDDERYSWVAWASHEGYPTLAIDRLGNGNSSLPNGVTVVQCPAQAESIHQLILIARSSRSTEVGLPRSFQKIIYVGNSLGSIVGNNLHTMYPYDVDASILGGFSKSWILAVPGFVLNARLIPALDKPLGYLRPSSRAGTSYVLFYGPVRHYDVNFIRQDYDNRGTVTAGEGVSGSSGIGVAPRYAKPILLINGEQDVLFCGTTALDGKPGNCKNGIMEQTKELYPIADYSFSLVPNAGHCWHHQYNALGGYEYSHDWLASRGF